MLLRILVAFLTGISLSFAFEPLAWAYVVPFSLVGFALTTRGLRARSGWIPGLAFGVGFYFVHIYWMRASIGTDAWLMLAFIEALFYGALGSVAAVLHRLPAWPAWLAAAWVSMEVVRSDWPWSGMPWGRLGFGVIDTPVAPALGYVGVNGTGFLLAALGFLLARLLVSQGGRERLGAGVALAAVAAVTLLPALVPATLTTTGEATVAAVQGNVPGRGNNVLFDVQQLTQNHVDATVGLAEDVEAGAVPAPDFVVWPENSTATDPFEDPTVNAGINEAVAAIGVPVIVGGLVDDGPEHILNQGIVWDPVTGPGERYSKRNPVPFGEYVPLRPYLPTGFGRLDQIPRDMKTGTRSAPLRVAGIDVADSICFDIAYEAGINEQVANGAELLTVQTSNASYIFTDQIDQQFAMTRLRAIEYGRWVVVAASNGISGVIAPDGSVVAATEALTQDVLVETVDLKEGMTPGVRVGATLRWLMPALTLLGLVLVALTYRRRSGDDEGLRPAGDHGTTGGERVER